MEYAMEHSVSRTVVASECSPPPMCGLGRSEGFWRIAPLVIVPTVAVAVVVVRIDDRAWPPVRLSSFNTATQRCSDLGARPVPSLRMGRLQQGPRHKHFEN